MFDAYMLDLLCSMATKMLEDGEDPCEVVDALMVALGRREEAEEDEEGCGA